MEELEQQGANISYSDPHIPFLPPMRAHHIRLASAELSEGFLASQDCAVIVTDHSGFDYAWIAAHCPLLVDTRNATAKVASARARIVKA